MGYDATLIGGNPGDHMGLYHAVRFGCHDAGAYLRFEQTGETVFIVRDIELLRAREQARADRVYAPAELAPAGGLSKDRDTGVAQAVAECLRRGGASRVRVDRATPMLFAHVLMGSGFEVVCDPDLGAAERRAKDEQEVAWLTEAQAATEEVMRLACETIARASPGPDGSLSLDGAALTSERVRAMIDVRLLELGYSNGDCVVAGGVHGADPHERGSGVLRTAEAVVIDIFPRNKRTLYNGDCTRCVVNGEVPDAITRMHAAVVEAKAAGIARASAGTPAGDLHADVVSVIEKHGFAFRRPGIEGTGAAMLHGTGHGIGLDVHEPPLLDEGQGPLIAGDAVTIEPGLYDPAIGGIRIEDMVIVTEDGAMNLNSLPEGLGWA